MQATDNYAALREKIATWLSDRNNASAEDDYWTDPVEWYSSAEHLIAAISGGGWLKDTGTVCVPRQELSELFDLLLMTEGGEADNHAMRNQVAKWLNDAAIAGCDGMKR